MSHNYTDKVIEQIADYVDDDSIPFSDLAYKTAHDVLIDSIGCALLALNVPVDIVKALATLQVPVPALTMGRPVLGAW